MGRAPALREAARLTVLAWLSIQGLALVDSLELEFAPGLNVLTGETGAGKSIVLGSIGLLLGERADAAWLRAGATRGFVEGTFDLSARPDLVEAVRALEVEPEESRVVVRREIHADGRSRALVNGRTTLLGPLRALGEVLVDLHGQHEHQQLLKPERQADFFDLWAGTAGEREEVERERAALLESARALAEARARAESDRENEARLREDAEELKRAALQVDEEEHLRRERDRLQHRERILAGVSEAADSILDDERGAAAVLKRTARGLQHAAALDAGLAPLLDDAQALLSQAADLGGRIEQERERLLEDPLDLDALESRLDRIHRLKRKHGVDLPGLVALAAELDARLRALAPNEDSLQDGERAHAKRLDAFRARLDRFIASRAAAATPFAKEVGTRLAKLGFGKAALRVESAERVAAREGAGRDGGFVDPPSIPGLHFSFQPNPGEAARPIQRIASGGELSRVMLAVKSLMAERDRVSVLVFDEVDQGIGGAVAEEVGRLLHSLGERRQVLCITHLPMIAAFGSRHFEVSKGVEAGRTTTSVRALEGSDREDEIARLLAGARATDTTRKQARELLRAAADVPAATGATAATKRATAPAAQAAKRRKGAA
ncbi:MAG TPA: DNA repair protein RecN [Candidatus Eisenbacteria bacterium]|nr:DNA repair protein RecN [Candidatus Eisenbacteria bacterium]